MRNKNCKVILGRGWTGESKSDMFAKSGWLNLAVILDYTAKNHCFFRKEYVYPKYEAWAVNNDWMGEREFDLRGLLHAFEVLPDGEDRAELIKKVEGMVESPEFLDLEDYKKTFLSECMHGKVIKIDESDPDDPRVWVDSLIHRHHINGYGGEFGMGLKGLDVRGVDSDGVLHINDWDDRPKMHLGVLRFSCPKKLRGKFPLLRAA